MNPTLVIVGRPKVGKPTLFNRPTRPRDARVANAPGLTRDRHYGVGRLGERPYLAVDTGGMEALAGGVFVWMAKPSATAIPERHVASLGPVPPAAPTAPNSPLIGAALRSRPPWFTA